MLMELRNHLAQEVGICHGVPTGVGGELRGGIGDQRDLRWAHLTHHADKIFSGIAFDVELCLNVLREVIDITAADMTLVGTWVYRDALCPETLAIFGHTQHIGIVAPSCVAQGGYFVDVHT